MRTWSRLLVLAVVSAVLSACCVYPPFPGGPRHHGGEGPGRWQGGDAPRMPGR